MGRTNLQPLDPLQRYYNLISEGKIFKVECKRCKSVYTSVALAAARGQFKKHLLDKHPGVYSDKYEMTQEDYDLDKDFDLLGKPTSNPLHFRKYICFEYDSLAKRPSFVYCLLSKLLIGQPELDKKSRSKPPCADIFLDAEDRLIYTDYIGNQVKKEIKLPEDYEVGHVLGLGLVRFSTRLYDIVNCLSDVAIQHKQLNHGLWKDLDKLVEGLLLLYKVRVMPGTSGRLDLPCTSPAQIPRWWFNIIVTSDPNNTNWRYAAFLFPNIECKGNLKDYQVTIPQLEAVIRMPIFPNIIADLQTDYVSDIAPDEFEEWAMTKWFSTSPPASSEYDDYDENDTEPGPSRKKMKAVPLVFSDEED